MRGLKVSLVTGLLAALLLVPVGAGVVAGEPPAAPPLEFHRVHVPAGRLADVQLDDERYVPMSITEFEAAVARAADGRNQAAGVMPRAVADTATYAARLDDDGVISGLATCVVSPAAAAIARALPLGAIAARHGTFANAAGGRDAVIFGTPGGGSFLQTLAGGTYGFEFVCPPVVPGSTTFRLPLVASLATTMELLIPEGAVLELVGGAARHAVVAPPSGPEKPWRIEAGPAAELTLAIHSQRDDLVGLALWSAVEIRGQQAAFAATVRPSGAWRPGEVVLDKDAAARITAVHAAGGGQPLEWNDAADGGQIVIRVPSWLAGGRGDLTVQGVAPAVGSRWRLPLLTVPQRRWAGGGSVVRIDPAFGVATLDLDGCRIVTAAVAGRWPVPRIHGDIPVGADEATARPALFNVEEQSSAATCQVSLRPRVPTFDVARVTTVEISPRALLGRAVCDIRVVDGEAFEITARLAPGWIPDSVELLEWGEESPGGEPQPLKPVANASPIDWRFVQSPGGDSLRIPLPLGATPARGLGLRVVGHRAGIQRDADFMTSDIDMVQFDGERAGMAVIDIKTIADSFMEIDDMPVGMLPAEGRLARLVEAGTIRGRIFGGELAVNRRARLVTRRPPVDADVAVRLEARDERLTETFLFDCRPEAGGLESLVVDVSEPIGEGLEWLVTSPEGIAVTARLLPTGDATGRTARRPESVAESWLLEFRPAVEQQVSIRATRTIPFTTALAVPLAWVREASAEGGTVTIAAVGHLLPEVRNQRLLELPARPDARAAGSRSLEFAYGPPTPVAGAPAELVPTGGVVDTRAWGWREDVSCRCEESGVVECESRFAIENEGRDAVSVTIPVGQRLQGVSVDGRSLPGDMVAAAGATLRVPLPVAERRVDLVVRSTLTRDPAAGWWWVAPQGCGTDLPILERSIRLLLPPELEAFVVDGGYRPPDPVATGWADRLLGITFAARRPGESTRSGVAPPLEAGFRVEAFAARGSRDGGGIIVIRRRLLAAASLLVALGVGSVVLFMASRRWSAAVAVCLMAALAAIWAPIPLYEVARSAWWAALAGSACGLMARRRGAAAVLVAAALATGPVAAEEPQSFRVFITPGGTGDMALVPEALFRQLAVAGQSAATIRVVRCDVFAKPPVEAGAEPWRVELELDADAGGTLLLDEPAGAAWRVADAAVGGSVLARPVGNGLRLTAATAGRQRVEVEVAPRVERRGGVEIAEVRLPAAPAAAVHLVGDPLPANAVICERSMGGQPFLSAPVVGPASAAAVFDVSAAERVRLVRPLDPRDRITAEPSAATTVNEVQWGLTACTVQTRMSLDSPDLLHAVVLRADERLERVKVAEGDAAAIQAVGPGRWLLELPRADRGKVELTLTSRMPLADPVGRFRVPAVWLDGVAGELRTVQVAAAADLDIVVDPPVGSGVTATEFEAGPAPQVTVRRRRQQPRGAQNLAVTFGGDRIAFALRAQIDATTLAFTELPVQVPPGCIIDRVSLLEDDLVAAVGRPQPAVDIVWTRKATDRVVIVVQQPRAGRFRLVIDARLRIRPPARGRVPLMRAEIAGGGPLMVSCSAEAEAGMAVRLPDVAAVRGTGNESNSPVAERAEVFASEPGPEYLLEPVEVAPAAPDAAAAADAPAVTGAAAGESRVELTDVFLAIDVRGRGRGAVRFDVATNDPTLLLRLPRGMRLYDLMVDGAQVSTVPRAADTWELRLHGVAWPRTILAIFAGDVGTDFVAGRPISLPPPCLVGLATGDVLWTILPPPAFEGRLSEPARPLERAEHAAARRAAQRRIAERFDAAASSIDARQQKRLRKLIDLRRDGGATSPEAAWQQAMGWPAPGTAGLDVAFAVTAGAADLTLRVVRRPDATTPGRAWATCGVVVAAGLAWRLATWKAGRRRQGESDLAHAADHR